FLRPTDVLLGEGSTAHPNPNIGVRILEFLDIITQRQTMKMSRRGQRNGVGTQGRNRSEQLAQREVPAEEMWAPSGEGEPVGEHPETEVVVLVGRGGQGH